LGSPEGARAATLVCESPILGLGTEKVRALDSVYTDFCYRERVKPESPVQHYTLLFDHDEPEEIGHDMFVQGLHNRIRELDYEREQWMLEAQFNRKWAECAETECKALTDIVNKVRHGDAPIMYPRYDDYRALMAEAEQAWAEVARLRSQLSDTRQAVNKARKYMRVASESAFE